MDEPQTIIGPMPELVSEPESQAPPEWDPSGAEGLTFKESVKARLEGVTIKLANPAKSPASMGTYSPGGPARETTGAPPGYRGTFSSIHGSTNLLMFPQWGQPGSQVNINPLKIKHTLHGGYELQNTIKHELIHAVVNNPDPEAILSIASHGSWRPPLVRPPYLPDPEQFPIRPILNSLMGLSPADKKKWTTMATTWHDKNLISRGYSVNNPQSSKIAEFVAWKLQDLYPGSDWNKLMPITRRALFGGSRQNFNTLMGEILDRRDTSMGQLGWRLNREGYFVHQGPWAPGTFTPKK